MYFVALMLGIFFNFIFFPLAIFFPICLKSSKIAKNPLKITIFAIACLQVFQNCQWTEPELTSANSIDQAGPNCASCHAYPLLDTNHVFHLFELDSSLTNDRPITCLHCHVNSIAGHDTAFADSIFQDVNGNRFHALDFPDIQMIRDWPLVSIDTLYAYKPLFQPPRPGPPPEMLELQTSFAHLNGKVDVDFNETSNNPMAFEGREASYDPVEMTCSAVYCHPNDVAYRWARPSKNIPMENGDPNNE